MRVPAWKDGGRLVPEIAPSLRRGTGHGGTARKRPASAMVHNGISLECRND
jgi:hypothetical protein